MCSSDLSDNNRPQFLSPSSLNVTNCASSTSISNDVASYIQQELTISGGTVRTHTDHIYKKLDVHSQQELIDIIESFATPTRKK